MARLPLAGNTDLGLLGKKQSNQMAWNNAMLLHNQIPYHAYYYLHFRVAVRQIELKEIA